MLLFSIRPFLDSPLVIGDLDVAYWLYGSVLRVVMYRRYKVIACVRKSKTI